MSWNPEVYRAAVSIFIEHRQRHGSDATLDDRKNWWYASLQDAIGIEGAMNELLRDRQAEADRVAASAPPPPADRFFVEGEARV